MAGNSFQSPVSGESSIGTPHPTKDANRTTVLVVNTATNTAGVWSAAVTMPNVPTGAKAAWCMTLCNKATVNPILCVEAATGYTLSDISTAANNYLKYVFSPYMIGAQVWGYIRIHLDSSGQFKWCTSISSSTVNIASPIDYEM